MPASRRSNWIARLVTAVIAIAVAWFAYGYFSAWQRFASEDRFSGALDPVTSALHDFQQQTRSLPTNLAQLVPRYLAQIPSGPVVDSIDYQVLTGGTNWQLSVRSHVRGAQEFYVQRSSREFTPEEQRRSVTGFHGWLVFRE
jgi:hypothetical protein